MPIAHTSGTLIAFKYQACCTYPGSTTPGGFGAQDVLDKSGEGETSEIADVEVHCKPVEGGP